MSPTSQNNSPGQKQAAPKQSQQNQRFYLLDGLRGVLALFVVYRHCPEFLAGSVPSENFFLAVDFFFCLSGFVIAYAYEDRLRTKLNLRDFIVARLLRFYPMFLIGTLLALVSAIGPEHLLSSAEGRGTVLGALPSLVFLPSLPLAPSHMLFPLNMPSWTLLTELIANLGFGILVRRKLPVLRVLAFVGFVSALELLFTTRSFDSGSTWPGFAVGMARMGFSFSLGVFVFRLWQRLPLGGLRRQRGYAAALLVVVLLLTSITLHIPFTHTRLYQFSAMALLMPTLIFIGADVQLGAFWNRACVVLGDMSYPLYIIHVPLLSPLYGAHVARLAHKSVQMRRYLVPACDLLLAAFAWLLEATLNAPLRRSLSGAYRRYVQNTQASPAFPSQHLTTEPGTTP